MQVAGIVPSTPSGLCLEPMGVRRGHRVELRALEVFVAVADAGNMTIAARRLGMTQPAVSQIVRQLEKDLGSPLLDRELRPLRPTSTGLLLSERARQLLTDAERLCAEVRHTENSLLPRLRIGLVESFASAIGSAFAAALQENVEQLVIRSGAAPELRTALISRELDMMVSPDALEESTDFDRTRLLRESYVVVIPTAMQRLPKELTLNALAAASPLVRLSSRTRMGVQVDRHLGWLRVEAPRRLEFDSIDSAVSAVAYGAGWAILPPLALARACKWLPRISVIGLPGPSLSRNLYLISRTGEFSAITSDLARRCSLILRAEMPAHLGPLAPWLVERLTVS